MGKRTILKFILLSARLWSFATPVRRDSNFLLNEICTWYYLVAGSSEHSYIFGFPPRKCLCALLFNTSQKNISWKIAAIYLLSMTGLPKLISLLWVVSTLCLQPCKGYVLSLRKHRCNSSLFGRRASCVKQYGNSAIDKGGGALYRQSVLTKEEFVQIQTEVSSLMTKLNEETSSSVAQKRMGASLPKDSKTVRILKEGSLRQLVQRLTGDLNMVLSSELPVEVRSYEKFGAGMAWHEDDVLYDPPQVEAVITLENTSDCVTMWKNYDKLESRETDPNSALILKAGGPSHCVTSLKRGRRVILKCAFASSEAKFITGIHKDQFGKSKEKPQKRR